MGKIVVKIDALKGAITNLENLASEVSTSRMVADNSIPSRLSVDALSASGPAGTFETWATEQIESPLQIVLDTATLLQTDGETGPVTITYTGPYSIEKVEDQLADLLSTALQDSDSKGDLEKYLTILQNHENNSDLQTAVVASLGQAGVVSLLTKAGDAGVPMETVTNAFNAESEETISGWVADDIADPKNIDNATVTLLAGFGRSAEFSEGLYTEVTPDQMTEAIQHLNDAAFPNGIPGGYDADAQELYSKFINGAGTSFATYTNAVDDPVDLAETWFNAITDDDNTGNAAALTFLIRKGGENAEYDPDFLYNLTENVFQWERDQDGAVWGPRVESDTSGMGLGGYLFDPDAVVDGDLSTIDPARRVDGLANLLGSMEYTPEAAQRFFANGYEGSGTDGENSRIDYLMMDRTFAGSNNSDDGYGLGVALEAAASGNTTREYISGVGYSDEWSAGFATDLFEYVAKHEDAETGDSWFPNVLGDNRYHGYPGTSVALGNIASAYTDDVYELLRESGAQYGEGTTLQITQDQLKQVLGQVGYHDDMSGLETLSAALMSEGNERFRDLLEDRPPPHTLASLEGTDLTGVLDPNGEVMGNLLDAGLADKYEGDELKKQRAALAAKAFDIASNFVPGAGKVFEGVKDTLWETVIDTGKKEGVNALKDLIANSPDYTADQYAKLQDNEFQPLIRYNTYDQLLATGYLDEFDFPPSMIVGEGEDRRFRQDIRFEGVAGLPDDMPEAEQDEIDEWIKLLLTNDTTQNGPGAHLQGLISDALNGYDRIRPPK